MHNIDEIDVHTGPDDEKCRQGDVVVDDAIFGKDTLKLGWLKPQFWHLWYSQI